MHYPSYNFPPLGGGLLVAIVAITHVVIAHFAVGAGFFIAITQTIAVRRHDALLLRFLRDQAKFLVLLAFVAGAVSGVGIWFSIGIVSPAATSALIHQFVWGWAAEYCFFLIEIVAGYVYYYGWDRLSPRRHLAVAWIYAIAAFMSLFIINGIITFMLTPGEWVSLQPGYNADAAYWVAFFNPTFWPSLLLRTISSLALAGIFVAVTANIHRRYSRDEKQRIINVGSYYLVPLGAMAPLAIWYFEALPPLVRELALGGAIAMTLFMSFGVVSSLFIAAYSYFGLIRRKRYINTETSLLLLAVAFVATGSMEFVREGIRKPFLIHGYLYSNGIPATREWQERLDHEGVLAHARFAYPASLSEADLADRPLEELGRYVFEAECRACHEPGGTNDLAPMVARAAREWIEATTADLHGVKYFMPPFMGTQREREALVAYQMSLRGRGRTDADPGHARSASESRTETQAAQRGEGK